MTTAIELNPQTQPDAASAVFRCPKCGKMSPSLYGVIVNFERLVMCGGCKRALDGEVQPIPTTLQIQSDSDAAVTDTTLAVGKVVELSYDLRICYAVVRRILPDGENSGRTVYIEIFTVHDSGSVSWFGTYVEPMLLKVRPGMTEPIPVVTELDKLLRTKGSDERKDDRPADYVQWNEAIEYRPKF